MNKIKLLIVLTSISVSFAQETKEKTETQDKNTNYLFKMMNEQHEEVFKKLKPEELTKLNEIQPTEEQKKIMLNELRIRVFMLNKLGQDIESQILNAQTQVVATEQEPEEYVPEEEKEKTIERIELAKEDLSQINLQQLTHPLPTELKVGASIKWNHALSSESYNQRRHFDEGKERTKERPILIFGERKLKISKITANKFQKTLTLTDDLKRSFTINFIDWLRTQHTKDGQNSLLNRIIDSKAQGYPLEFSKCIDTIGELKEKCFNIPFNKDPTLKICPPQTDFPPAIAQSLNFLCGHVEKPRLKIKSTQVLSGKTYYLVDAEPDTIYFLVRFNIASLDTERYFSDLERQKRIAESEERQRNMRFEPRNFSHFIQRAAEKEDKTELEALIKEAREKKNTQGESLLDQILKDRMSSLHGLFDYFIKKGEWAPIIDELLAHQTYGKFRLTQKTDPTILFLRAAFIGDHMEIEEIRKSPELIKGWEDFITKHKIPNISANFNFYITRRQGTQDPVEGFLGRFGLMDEFKKNRELHNLSLSSPQPSMTELQATVEKFPFLVDNLPNRFREDGALCLAAVESELKSDYFTKGLCRLMPFHGSPNNWNCIPRAKYPPNGDGYITACRENFKTWIKKLYPEKFAKK